jgi:cell division control protein 24
LSEDAVGWVWADTAQVLRVINRVLDILAEKGKLLRTNGHTGNPGDVEQQPRSHQGKVIEELVTTERDYVQHLETLQQFKTQVEQAGSIPGDIVHDIFMNLNALLDFQRRFLIRIEQQNSLDPEVQNWGHLFVQYQEGFRVYEPFIANQIRCNETVTREWEKIRAVPIQPAFQGLVETQSVFGGFLIKPFQRLTKYPMLLNVGNEIFFFFFFPLFLPFFLPLLPNFPFPLANLSQELIKNGNYTGDRLDDLQAGYEATSAILRRANETIDKQTLLHAVDELVHSVDDWKGHKIEQFGELLLFGTQTVLKSDGPKEVEREVCSRPRDNQPQIPGLYTSLGEVSSACVNPLPVMIYIVNSTVQR